MKNIIFRVVNLKEGDAVLRNAEFKRACKELADGIRKYINNTIANSKKKDEQEFWLTAVRRDGAKIIGPILATYESRFGRSLPIGYVNGNLERDDFRTHLNISDGMTKYPNDADTPEGKHIILVDTVIEKGRTINAAVNAIFSDGRPKSIGLVTIIDRLGRECPYRPNVCYAQMPNIPKHLVVKPGGEPTAYLELQRRR
jgi:pyrimidine operon attenuation protein/uracil phosphoribosyltransferase